MVGLFVLLAMGLLVVAVFLVGSRQQMLELRYELRAIFSSVAGLQIGAPVRLGGLSVGLVHDIRFVQDISTKKVEVILSIKSSVRDRIREDSMAAINTLGLLGDKYVEISLGSEDSPVLQPRAIIQSRNPVELSQVISSFNPVLSGIPPILEQFQPILENTHQITESLNGILAKVNKGEGTLGGLVNDPRVYESLVNMTNSSNKFLTSLNEVFDAFKQTGFYREYIKGEAPKKVESGTPFFKQKITPNGQPIKSDSILP
jgi:phospholipid/cholesterol/gamma-HCH transport system substrate-binding protein